LKITVIKGPVIEEHVRIVNFHFHGTASLEFDIYQNGYEFRHTICIFLWFLSPCIIIHSNKSTNQMHQSLRFISRRSNTAQHVSGILLPIIRTLQIALAASSLPLERGGSSAVGRGR